MSTCYGSKEFQEKISLMRLREGCSCYISLGKKEGIESFHIITEKGDCLLVNFDWKKTRNPIPSHSLTIGRGA